MKNQKMNQYEQSALVFYSEKNFIMSYNLFLDALSTDKENSMLWYGQEAKHKTIVSKLSTIML